jgi:hypothetical protein
MSMEKVAVVTDSRFLSTMLRAVGHFILKTEMRVD